MQCFPLKTACEEQARLLRRHAAAESDYYRAIHVLSVAIRSLKKPDGNDWKISRTAQERWWKRRGTRWSATLASTDANTGPHNRFIARDATFTLSPHPWQMNGSMTLKPGNRLSSGELIMPEIEHFTNIVFGSSTGGKIVAWTLAEAGQRTAMVERKWIGGSCHNIACRPSKNVIHSAKVASLFGRAAEFGIETGAYSINMERARTKAQNG